MTTTRKKITLPSGGTVVVRKIAAQDFALHQGEIPAVYQPEVGRAAPRAPGQEYEPSQRQIAEGIRSMRVVLLSCCSPITGADGIRRKLVEKDLDQTTDAEITIGELSDQDAQAIVTAVAELTNLGKEAASAARKFPEESETPGVCGPAGPALSEIADGTSQAVA